MVWYARLMNATVQSRTSPHAHTNATCCHDEAQNQKWRQHTATELEVVDAHRRRRAHIAGGAERRQAERLHHVALIGRERELYTHMWQ